MDGPRKQSSETKRPLESYEHKGKQRVNNPPVGLVTPDTTRLFLGYLLGAAVMLAGGVVAAVLGVNAEGKSLEEVATPLSAVDRLLPAYPAGPRSKDPLEQRIRLT